MSGAVIETAMRELTKAAFSASLALPLFGLQQVANLLRAPGEVSDALDQVTRGAEASLDGTLKRLCELSDRVQLGAVDALSSIVGSGVLKPATLLSQLASVLAAVPERSAAGARLAVSGGGALTALEEVRNKLEVFFLVILVSALIGEPRTLPLPLLELLGRAYAMDDFHALWAVEGLGHDYAASFWKQGTAPQGILGVERQPNLLHKSLTMLNAGIGLGIAENRLKGLPPSPYEEVRRRVTDVVELCRDNTRPGYFGCAVEQLGLYPTSFNAQILGAVERAVREVAPEVLGFFWHGVGRATFFLFPNILPCSDWEMFEAVRRQAPDERARLHATAGLAWAYVLVNQRQPNILAELLIGPHGEELARDGGFVNGLQSTLMMRYDTTPDAPFIANFLRYRPKGCEELWDRLVRTPAQQALEVVYPVLVRENRLGEIFEYQDLAARVGAAPSTPGAGAAG